MSKSAIFSKDDGRRIAGVVRYVERSPLYQSGNRGGMPARYGGTFAFWGRIVTIGRNDSADYTDERYWVREQRYSTATSVDNAFTDADSSDDGLWVTAYNLAEYSLPSAINGNHLIVAPLLGVDCDSGGDSSNYTAYNDSVIVPIYRIMTSDTQYIYVFELLRGQFVEQYDLMVTELDGADSSSCPITYRWDKRIIEVFNIVRNSLPPDQGA